MHVLEEHLHLTKLALVSMREEDDPLSFAQACFFMFYAYMYNQDRQRGKRYLILAAEAIIRNKIRATPQDSSSSVPALTEEVHERISFLAEVLCCEGDLVLVSGGIFPLLGEIDRQFEEELPVCSFSLFYSLFLLTLDRTSILCYSAHAATQCE